MSFVTLYITAKPTYNGTTRDPTFFRWRQVLSHTGIWSLDPRYCKIFPLKTGFLNGQGPFKRGFILQLNTEYGSTYQGRSARSVAACDHSFLSPSAHRPSLLDISRFFLVSSDKSLTINLNKPAVALLRGLSNSLYTSNRPCYTILSKNWKRH